MRQFPAECAIVDSEVLINTWDALNTGMMLKLTAHIRRFLWIGLVLWVTGCADLASPAATSTPGPIPTVRSSATPQSIQPTSTSPPVLAAALEAIDDGPANLPEVNLDVELFYRERWMRVHQTVELINSSGDIWHEVVFNVPLHHLPDLFFLDSATVTVASISGDVAVEFPAGDTLLRVPLPFSAQPGDPIAVDLHYRVVIPPVAKTDWPPNGTTGWTFDLIQAGEWYPALVPYDDGQGWHEWVYHPVGDPTVYELTNTSLTVRTEPGITVMSGGPLGQADDGAWQFRVERARGVAFLASDRYVVEEGQVGEIPIRSAYLPEHELAGQTALEIAVQSILLYEELYGSYPYDSLTIAENGFFGGMEYSALITVTDYAYYVYQGEPPSILHSLVSHEVGHQWWYGAVGNDQANEPWLDEALAFYGELLYLERYYPELSGWWWEKRVYQYGPSGPVNARIYDYDDSQRFILTVYGRSAEFMRDLRNLMGDEAFFTFLRDYYADNQWGMVTADDFFSAVNTATDADLERLFTTYFDR